MLLFSVPSPAQTTIHYACDEEDGVELKDSGPLKAHGALVVRSSAPIQNATFAPAERDQWFPILSNGVQVKGIRPKSDQWVGAADDEIPLVYHANADYEIDYAGGRAKALGSGRMEARKTYLVTLVAPNEGPRRVRTDKGMALRFDGVDDCADCGEPEAMKTLTSLAISLWFQGAREWNRSAILVSKGDGLSLGFEDGRVVFRHVGLKTADGRAADATRSAAAIPVEPGVWHRLRASWAKGVVAIELDGKEVARTDGLADGPMATNGPLRLGGTVDPRFFGGLLKDVRVDFVDGLR